MSQPAEKYSAFLALTFSEVDHTNKPKKNFLILFQKIQTANFIMCKPRVERDTSDQHKTETMNLGLVNMSKNGDGLDAADIVIYVICAISVIMVLKWLKKCYNRKVRQAQTLVQQAQPVQFQQLHVPALPQPIAEPGYRVTYRPASITEEQAIVEDSMKKYQN